jgi:hypothetical protein
MKLKFSHTEKALLISLLIELVIIVLLFNIGFKEKPKEAEYAVEFVNDDFDFNELKPEEKIELPDVSKYIGKKYTINRASNALQEEKSFEEFKQQHENAIRQFYENRANNQTLAVGEKNEKKPEKKQKKEKRYTGESNIRYFIKNRYDIYIANPLYTCPEYMSGLIVIDIEVNKNGNVISAKFNKEKSTTTAECLIDGAIQAAYESYFNRDDKAAELQKGYITYRY